MILHKVLSAAGFPVLNQYKILLNMPKLLLYLFTKFFFLAGIPALILYKMSILKVVVLYKMSMLKVSNLALLIAPCMPVTTKAPAIPRIQGSKLHTCSRNFSLHRLGEAS